MSVEQKRTKTKKEEFFEHYIRSGRYISRTCKAIGISRWTFYSWKKKDFGFALTLDEYQTRSRTRKEMFAESWAKMKHNGVSDVCRRIGLSRWSYYHWRKTDHKFPIMIRIYVDAEREWRKKMYEQWLNS